MSKRRRRGATYLFDGYDPYALLKGRLKICTLYVGKTRQRPENRWRQHLLGGLGAPAQPWASLVTDVHTLKEWEAISDWWLSGRETLSIGWRQPRCNICLNMGNPKRIPPWEMRRLMTLIDRRGGVAALVEKAKGPVEKGLRLADGRVIERYGTRIEQEVRDGVAAVQQRRDTPGRLHRGFVVPRLKDPGECGAGDVDVPAVQRGVPGVSG